MMIYRFISWKQKKWLNALYIPFLLGLLWTVVLLYLVNFPFDPLKVKSFVSYPVAQNERCFVDNIYNPDECHMVSVWSDLVSGDAAIKLRSMERNSLFQENLNSKHLSPNKAVFVEDLSGDKTKEICFLTYRNDSILANVFDPASQSYVLREAFVDSLGRKGRQDYYHYYIGSFDVNKDGCKEVFFTMKAGFALYPRKLYMLDYKNKKVLSSLASGINYNIEELVITNDSSLYIPAGAFASNNCGPDFKHAYPDRQSYVGLFNEKLEFVAAPFGIEGAPTTSVFLDVFRENGVLKFVYFFNAQASSLSKTHFLSLNEKGEAEKFELRTKDKIKTGFKLRLNGRKYFLFKTEDGMRELILKERKLKKTSISSLMEEKWFVGCVGMQEKGREALAVLSEDQKNIELYNDAMKRLIRIPMGENCSGIQVTTGYIKQEQAWMLFAANRYFHHSIKLVRNPYYYFKYLIYFLVFVGFVLFFYVLFRFQEKRIQKKYVLKRRINELQLQNYKNQLNPHFALNAINSIGVSILKEDKLKAYDQFVNFSRLLSNVMENATEVFVSLQAELDFTENYLKIQKSRFKELFDYKIDVEDTVPRDAKLPKLLVQSAVENCVKHAFKEVKTGGFIEVQVRVQENKLRICVEDNGCGIDGTKFLGKGRGISVMREQLLLLERETNFRCAFNHSRVETGGTRVEILCDIFNK